MSDLPFEEQSRSHQVSLPVQGICGGVMGVSNAPVSAVARGDISALLKATASQQLLELSVCLAPP